MDKTLLKKLTENHLYAHSPAFAYSVDNDSHGNLIHEMSILREAANDLLQPRPEAIAYILKMAGSL